jgi:MFS family permease
MAEATAVRASSEQSGTDFRGVLRNHNFLLLWMAQLLSQLAVQMINFALVRQVSDLTTASGTAIAAIVICFTVPAILFSAVAGVFVERQSKRVTLVVTNVARGVAVLLYVLTVALPGIGAAYALAILYANTLVFSAITQFFAPAEASAIPLLVKRSELVAANSLFNLTLTASQLIGFVLLGPLLVPLLGYMGLYIVVFAAFALCAFLTWRLPECEEDDPDAAEALRDDAPLRQKVGLAVEELKEGWGFIRADSALVIAIVYWSVAIAVFMMVAVIGQKFLQDVLHINPEHLYFILVPGGLGLVAGVLLVGRMATEQNRPRMINYGLLFAGIALLALALTHDTLRLGAEALRLPAPPTLLSQVIIGALAFALGIFNSFISVPAQTVLQERAPEDIRARVFAAFYTVSNAILIVPLVIAGAMADVIGVLPTVVAIAVLVLLVAGVGLRYQRAHPQSLTGAGPAPPLASEPESLLPGVPATEVRKQSAARQNRG